MNSTFIQLHNLTQPVGSVYKRRTWLLRKSEYGTIGMRMGWTFSLSKSPFAKGETEACGVWGVTWITQHHGRPKPVWCHALQLVCHFRVRKSAQGPETRLGDPSRMTAQWNWSCLSFSDEDIYLYRSRSIKNLHREDSGRKIMTFPMVEDHFIIYKCSKHKKSSGNIKLIKNFLHLKNLLF